MLWTLSILSACAVLAAFTLWRALKHKEQTVLELSVALARAEESLKVQTLAPDAAAALFLEKAQNVLDQKEQSISHIISPLKEYLGKFDENLRRVESQRSGDRESLRKQIESLADSERLLRQETANLAKALKAPNVRGRWGEVHLRRLVELAGMVHHCDFSTQEHSQTQDGAIRPDMIIYLPGGRHIIIDAKVPLEAYLEASQAQGEQSEQLLKDHVRHLRAHITTLGKKGYWKYVQPSPEFSVLFLPTEVVLHAALDIDPLIIEWSMEQGVVLATPATLIGLLKAIAYGWKQESLSAHAEKVSDLGHELYKRIVDMASHFTKVGRSLQTAVKSYNETVGTLETRVLVTARKFKDLGAASSSLDLDSSPPVELQTRELRDSLPTSSED